MSFISRLLARCSERGFPKPDNITWPYTEASKEKEASPVTESKEKVPEMSNEGQQHEPTSLVGGGPTAAKNNWTAYKNETYARVKTIQIKDHLL